MLDMFPLESARFARQRVVLRLLAALKSLLSGHRLPARVLRETGFPRLRIRYARRRSTEWVGKLTSRPPITQEKSPSRDIHRDGGFCMCLPQFRILPERRLRSVSKTPGDMEKRTNSVASAYGLASGGFEGTRFDIHLGEAQRCH
jgi:hypothetical protein